MIRAAVRGYIDDVIMPHAKRRADFRTRIDPIRRNFCFRFDVCVLF
jgi:hypothetical protein